MINDELLWPDQSLDTHGVVDVEVLRRMSGATRCAIAFRLSEIARLATMLSIRRRHPHYDDAQVRKAYFRLKHGDETMKTIWPNDALVDA